MLRNSSKPEVNVAINEFLENLDLPPIERESPGIALFEFQTHLIGQAAYSFFIRNCLSQKLRPVCFSMQSDLSFKARSLERLRFKLRLDTIASRPNYILNRMQIKKLVQVVRSHKASNEIKSIVNANIGVAKDSVLQLRYRGILIGDLFYDWHLSKRSLPTLDTNTRIFKVDLTEFLIRAKSWDKYFQNNNVKMVVVTHAVYLQGIVLRFGLKYEAKVFLVTPEKLHQFSEAMFLADAEWVYYNTNKEFKLGHPRN